MDYPWGQDDSSFTVKLVKGFKCNNAEYNGVEIVANGEPRDINKDLYKLEAAGPKPTNEFLLTMPLQTGALWRDKKQLRDDQKVLGSDAFQVANGKAVTQHRKLSDMEKERHFTLRFPADYQLTDEPFRKADQKPGQDIVPDVSVVYAKTGHEEEDESDDTKTTPIFNITTNNAWRLINTATQEDITADKKKNKGHGSIAAKLKKSKSARENESDSD